MPWKYRTLELQDPAATLVHASSLGCVWARIQTYHLTLACTPRLPAAGPSSCVPAHPNPAPFTGLYSRAHTHGETLQLQECMPTVRASKAACGPSSHPVFCYWPAYSDCFQIASQLCPCIPLARLPSLAYTGLHALTVTPCSHSSARSQPGPCICQLTYSWPQPLLLAQDSDTAYMFAAGSHHYTGTCGRSLRPNVCMYH